MKKKEKAEAVVAPSKPASDPAPNYKIVRGLDARRFEEIATELVEIKRRIAAYDERRKELQAEGAGLLIAAKVKTVLMDDGARVTRTGGGAGRKSLKRDLLFKNAAIKKVPAKTMEWIVAKSTVEGKSPDVGLKITLPGEGKDGGEESEE